MSLMAGDGRAVATTRTRLVFLYGDLGFSTKTIAAILGVAETDVAEACKRYSVKWCHHVFGQLGRKTFQALAKLMGFDSGEIDSSDPRHEWQLMRTMLSREFLRLAGEDSIPWTEVDAFLARLPEIQAQAKARVTPTRLEFLYGDLGATLSEIMMFLDVPKEIVYQCLVCDGIERHYTYHPELDEHAFDELARRLGDSAWSNDSLARRDAYYQWPVVKREMREGLARLAKVGQLDLVVLDEFLAGVPAIVEHLRQARRARFGLPSSVVHDGKSNSTNVPST